MSSVVICDLNVVGIAFMPSKAHAPLLVDTNRMLALTGSFELLQSVSWRDSEILNCHCRIKKYQLLTPTLLNVFWELL